MPGAQVIARHTRAIELGAERQDPGVVADDYRIHVHTDDPGALLDRLGGVRDQQGRFSVSHDGEEEEFWRATALLHRSRGPPFPPRHTLPQSADNKNRVGDGLH